MNNSTLSTARLGLRRPAGSARKHTIGRSPVLVATAVMVLVWLVIHLGWQTPTLLGILAGAAGVMWLCRHRRDIVLGAATAAVTAAVPAVVVIIAASRGSAALPGAAAVLTGHILAGPIPTLTAWLLRPAVVSRPANAAIGSAVLLAAAVPVTVFGDHGFGATVLTAGITGAVSTVVLRHRRAIHRLLQDLTEISTPGWTDLGSRVLPGGRQVHLMIGRGYALCAVTSSAKTIGAGLPHRSVTAAMDAARTLGIPASRVRPVVVNPGGPFDTRRGSVRRGYAEVTVVPSIAAMADLAAAAPRNRLRHRRVLAAAAALACAGSRT